jgi:undecaprenyl diphosphate synthase
MSYREQIDIERIPSHVAVIMDGNGRWAKKQGQERIFGHHNGVDSVDKVTEAAGELGIKYLTLYAFSTENWNRPESEVLGLMEILSSALKNNISKIMKNNVRLVMIGDRSRLSELTIKNMEEAEDMTKDNTGLTLILAISYSSRWEIVDAVKQIAHKVKIGEICAEEIDERIFSDHLATRNIPDPDLLIRTSGELRISNFLMWQLSYSELYFTDICWPEFKKEEFYQAILDYQMRERRFGKTSEQIS